MTNRIPSAILILAILLLVPILTSSNPIPVQSGGSTLGTIERVSLDSGGNQAFGTNRWPNISRNGRFITYHSSASNLVPNDTNNVQDIFLFDRLTHTTERISLGLGGVQPNNRSEFADITDDGRYVVFQSEASNLVPNDTNNDWDIFFRDIQTGQIERISVSSTGAQANGYSLFADISANGRFVTFFSSASNLVPNDTNGRDDIFLFDRQTAQIERVSVSSTGIQSNGFSTFPDISADGLYVVYESIASNLVPNDTNNATDIFLYNRLSRTTQRISLTTTGQQSDGPSSYGVIAVNNRHVTYVSYGANVHPDDPNILGDIYLRDIVAGTTELITYGFDNQPANNNSHYPFISNDGRFIVYHSEADNLVPNDTNNESDIFLKDRQTGITRRVNLSLLGVQGNGPSSNPAISANGRFLVFQSQATNLVPNDTNNSIDTFLYLDLTFRSYLPSFYP